MFAARRSFSCRRQTDRWMSRPAAAGAPGSLVLNRYLPVRPLGTGGSGSVWLAREVETDREVALKIVPREGTAGSRAEREAAAAARLRHPRCLRAHALARDAGHVYIVYEYVAGKTMREAMRAGELGDAATLEAAAQVLEGLAHAHAHGIVHRDVKPANVLLVEGRGISVKLFDFGLALMHEEQSLTAHGDIPGTLAYISPERLRGEAAGPAGRRLGGRRPALGVARRLPPVLGRHARSTRPRRSARERRRSASSAPTSRARSSRASIARCRSRPAAVPPLPASRARCARRRAGSSAAPCAGRQASAPRRAPAGCGAGRTEARARTVHELQEPAQRVAAAAGAARGRGAQRTRCRSSPAGWPLGIAAAAALITFLSEPAGARLLPRRPAPPARELLARARRPVRRSSRRPRWSRSGGLRGQACSSRSEPGSARSARSRSSRCSALAVRWPARRAVCVAGAVLVAAAAGSAARIGQLRIPATRSLLTAGRAVGSQLAHDPQVLALAAALALGAAVLPLVRRRGPLAAAAYALVVGGLTVVPAAAHAERRRPGGHGRDRSSRSASSPMRRGRGSPGRCSPSRRRLPPSRRRQQARAAVGRR